MRLLAISLLLLSTQPAAALDILTCGAVVPRGEVGVLQNDLTCSGEYAAVSLESGASVDLNGHAIHWPATKGVICLGMRCAVTSGVPGGEITGTITGIFKFTRGALVVSDVSVHDLDAPPPGDHGIEAPSSRVDLTRVSVLRTGYRGIIARRLRATDVESSAHGDAGVFVVRTLTSSNLTADGNAAGVVAKRINAENLVARTTAAPGCRRSASTSSEARSRATTRRSISTSGRKACRG